MKVKDIVRKQGDGSKVKVLKNLTINDAIERLELMRQRSPFKGETSLAWCGLGSEMEEMPICNIMLELAPEIGGAMVMVYTDGPREKSRRSGPQFVDDKVFESRDEDYDR